MGVTYGGDGDAEGAGETGLPTPGTPERGPSTETPTTTAITAAPTAMRLTVVTL